MYICLSLSLCKFVEFVFDFCIFLKTKQEKYYYLNLQNKTLFVFFWYLFEPNSPKSVKKSIHILDAESGLRFDCPYFS